MRKQVAFADLVTPNVRFGGPKAEVGGFEPPIPCGMPVFETGAFNHSATPPSAVSRPTGKANTVKYYHFL